MERAALSWIARCSIGAVAVLLACRVAAALLGGGLEMPATTTGDGSLYTLNRYFAGPVPDVVLVGSSLTFRLSEAYFTTAHVRNLALAGGSPLTGLAIVANQPQPPRIVLVETNVLSRPVDEALVARYAKGGGADRFLRPVRAIVATSENFSHTPPSRDQLRTELERLLGQPPSSFDNSVYVARVLREQDVDPTEEVRASVARMKQLIPALEQKGTRVLLFELPQLPEVERARAVGITHAIVHAAFPDNDRWLRIDVTQDQLRWADAFHLDERSAIIVARAIQKAVAGR
jgi:hypothetical protein